MIFVVAYQLALLLPHSARNWNIRRKEGNKQQTQPMLRCMGKENEKEEREKKQKQKYTFYYCLHHKFFSIIHPAGDWFILL